MTGQWEVLWKTFSRDLSQGQTVPKGRYRQDAIKDLLDVEDLARAGNLGKAMQRLLKVGAEPVAGTQPLTQEQAWEALRALHPQVQVPARPNAVHEPVSDELSETMLKALGFEEEGFTSRPLITALLQSAPHTAQDQWGWTARELLLKMVRQSEEFAELYVKQLLLPYALGGLPHEYAVMFSGALLVAIPKHPKPGVRPVGIPDLSRKLVSRMLLKPIKNDLAKYFTTKHPNYKQLAVGVRAGAEQMYHHVSLLAGAVPAPTTPATDLDCTAKVTAVIQLDFINAYN